MTPLSRTDLSLRASCAHCGLPLPLSAGSEAPLYCCHSCRLVSRIVGARNQSEQAWRLLRLGIGTLLSMNIMMISLLLYTGSIEQATVPVFRKLMLAMAAPALAILLYPFVMDALREIREGRMSLNSLIACGSLAAFLVSATNTLRGYGHVYYDTATMLPALVTCGKIMEAAAKTHAGRLLLSLETLLPSTALRIDASGVQEVPIELLLPGELVRIRPGERIAVDGIIREGSTGIEEAPFTGEALPRFCGPGDRVLAGTVNGTGSIVIEAEQTGKEILLHRIVAMADAARRRPSDSERIAERAAMLFVPFVLAVAAGAGIFWISSGDPAKAGLSVLAVLVVACPCTMGIATPMATSVAVSHAARAGIVVRGGDIMEKTGRIDLAFFDKTGTLTKNNYELQKIVLLHNQVTETELLGRLASLETAGEHVLARAIVDTARNLGIEPGTATNVTVEPGKGIRGVASWQGEAMEITAGTAAFAGTGAGEAERDELTSVTVSWGGAVRGRLLFAAKLRNDAEACVTRLKCLGIPAALLSGDSHRAASAIATKVGIDRVEAPRTPSEKQAAIDAAVAGGRTVAMVGDGINDAPALAAASIGVAIDCGMDLARRAGNVVILSDKLIQLPWLISLSRHARTVIRQNFAWSFAYNGIALGAASAGLLHPLLAALAMAASSLTVIANSMRISKFPMPGAGSV